MTTGAIFRSALVCLCLAAAGTLGVVLKPAHLLDRQSGEVDLQQMIPATFGAWKTEDSRSSGFRPDVQAEIDKIYAQVLDRTYVDTDGQHIMLSIAYGRDQENGSQLHRPEFCYEAQGFRVGDAFDGKVQTGFGEVPVRRMTATQGQRIETVTYWITVGHKATLPGIGRKLVQLSYGLSGEIPDGVLVRISSIDTGNDAQAAYALQQRFVHDLMHAVGGSVRVRLAGEAAA